MDNFRLIYLGFSLLHVDVWSEDGCRRRTGLCAYLLPHGGALSFYRMFSTMLLWCTSTRGVLLPAVLCGARIFPCPRVRAARPVSVMYNGVQFEEAKRKEVAS